jgi:hypothetical protein
VNTAPVSKAENKCMPLFWEASNTPEEIFFLTAFTGHTDVTVV